MTAQDRTLIERAFIRQNPDGSECNAVDALFAIAKGLNGLEDQLDKLGLHTQDGSIPGATLQVAQSLEQGLANLLHFFQLLALAGKQDEPKG